MFETTTQWWVSKRNSPFNMGILGVQVGGGFMHPPQTKFQIEIMEPTFLNSSKMGTSGFSICFLLGKTCVFFFLLQPPLNTSKAQGLRGRKHMIGWHEALRIQRFPGNVDQTKGARLRLIHGSQRFGEVLVDLLDFLKRETLQRNPESGKVEEWVVYLNF